MKIPLSRPDITQKEIDAVVDVLNTPTLSIGPKIEEFEGMVAKMVRRRYAIGVSSGTSGLHCAMLAAGIGPGDEVITTPFSFVASANCILYVGATPVFADINSRTLNMDLAKVHAEITPKTKAIVAVECFGHPGGMIELEQLARRAELTLIEDCCEGFGGEYGTGPRDQRPIGSFGKAGVFAFYPNKQITTGEGGMIITDDEEFAAVCRSLRNQGREGMGWLAHQRLGYNYRLNELSAALGIAQMERLEEILSNRSRVAAAYMKRLMCNKYLTLPTLDDQTHISWFVFVVQLNEQFEPSDRDDIIHALRGEGIGSSNYFPPIHLQPYMKAQFGFKEGDFPVTEYISARTLALPFFSKMTEEQIDTVCETLDRVLEKQIVAKKKRF
ncbi:MAG TPA: DegT/DnrJ/EryC1/StrS family aminotransferase [Tepidisphaeraceae bacterium]|nr:DegT/DnrJ/EryC1/StrS family aminotransferase [Tepidisphaeraceae bacterium]